MAEPKYYDELPTYIMHSDGEFKEGVFKAVDGSGNSITIGTEESDTEGKLTIEDADKAEFDVVLEKHESSVGTTKNGNFAVTIGGILFQVVASVMAVGGQTIEGLAVNFKKDAETIYFSLPSLNTLETFMNEISARVEALLPKNIKDGTGTGGVISGVVSGNNACEASGENSFAGGSGSTASGNCSVAFGEGSTASSDMSAAFNYAYAKAEAAFAANTGTASGEESFAVNYASAKGEASFACDNGVAVGDKSFAAGDHTAANGAHTFCCGSSTIANGQSQTVIGKFNVEQGSVDASQPTDNAFIIGNGTGQNARSNALAVRWDGAIVLANGTVLTVEQLAKVANLT